MANTRSSPTCAAKTSPIICDRRAVRGWQSQSAQLRDGAPSGFSDTEIALFEAWFPPSRFNLEVQALRRTAARCSIPMSVIWPAAAFSRGNSPRHGRNHPRGDLAVRSARIYSHVGTLPRDALIEMLNDYFGPMGDAVRRQAARF